MGEGYIRILLANKIDSSKLQAVICLAPYAMQSAAWAGFPGLVMHPHPMAHPLALHLQVSPLSPRVTETSGPHQFHCSSDCSRLAHID